MTWQSFQRDASNSHVYMVIISFYICVEREKPLYEQALKRGIVSTRRWRIFGLLCRSMLLEMCAIELFRPLARREKLPFSPDLVGRSRETEFSAFIRGWKINHICVCGQTPWRLRSARRRLMLPACAAPFFRIVVEQKTAGAQSAGPLMAALQRQREGCDERPCVCVYANSDIMANVPKDLLSAAFLPLPRAANTCCGCKMTFYFLQCSWQFRNEKYENTQIRKYWEFLSILEIF